MLHMRSMVVGVLLVITSCGGSTPPAEKPTPKPTEEIVEPDPPAHQPDADTTAAVKLAADTEAAAETLERRVGELDASLDDAIEQAGFAETRPDLAKWKANLQEIEKTRVDLETRAASAKQSAVSPAKTPTNNEQDMRSRLDADKTLAAAREVLQRIARDLADRKPKIDKALASIDERVADMDRADANAKLEQLKKEQAASKKKK